MGKKPVGITLYAAPIVVMIGLATLITDDWFVAIRRSLVLISEP